MEVLISIATMFSIIIVIILILKNEQNKSSVMHYSEKFQQLLQLNRNYLFYETKKYRTINYPATSKKNCEKLTFSDIIDYYLENNIDGLRSDIENIIYNKNLYLEYLKEFEMISGHLENQILQKLKMSEKKFQKYENKLIQKYKYKGSFDLVISIKIYYLSPKGRNYYEKKDVLHIDNLIFIYNQYKTMKNNKTIREIERSKMSASIRYDVLNRDKFRCQICGATQSDGVKLHVDHIIPISKGGKTEMNNLRTLCDRCNLGKSDKIE